MDNWKKGKPHPRGGNDSFRQPAYVQNLPSRSTMEMRQQMGTSGGPGAPGLELQLGMRLIMTPRIVPPTAKNRAHLVALRKKTIAALQTRRPHHNR